MPRYDYQNRDTKEVIEHRQSIHDPIPATIERDGKVFHRIFQAVPVQYWCFGFYSTDYALDATERWRKENLRRD